MVLKIGMDATRDVLDQCYEGSSTYLTALEEPSASSLIDRVRQHCPFLNDELESGKPAWAVETTLDWDPYRVFVVSHGRRSHQLILGTNDGRYRLLLLDLMSEHGVRLEVVQVAGQSLLVYRAGLGGNGGFEITGCFVLGPRDIPAVVNVDASVGKVLSKALPKGFSVVNGGGFDFQKLQFVHCVWKPDDGHASPTGGRIRVDFALVGHDLIPTRYCYDPKYDAQQDGDARESGNWGPFVDCPQDWRLAASGASERD